MNNRLKQKIVESLMNEDTGVHIPALYGPGMGFGIGSGPYGIPTPYFSIPGVWESPYTPDGTTPTAPPPPPPANPPAKRPPNQFVKPSRPTPVGTNPGVSNPGLPYHPDYNPGGYQPGQGPGSNRSE